MSSFLSPGDYKVTETELEMDIAVPLVDVAKMDTVYVPGARPKSTLYAVELPPFAGTLFSVLVE
jgi:hypothetical protein